MADLRLPQQKDPRAGQPPISPLNLSSARNDVESPSGGAATRRRWSVQGLFAALTPRGSSGANSPKLSLQEVIEGLNEVAFQTDDKLIRLGKRLLELCPDYTKIPVVAKAGAMEAVVHALADCDGKVSKAVPTELLPALCNLSAGDDDPGKERANKLVSLGAIESIGNVLRLYAAAPSEAGCSEDSANYNLILRSVWALQHLCRKEQLLYRSTSAWLNKLVDSQIVAFACTLPRRYPDQRKLLTRVSFLLSAVAYALVEAIEQGTARGSTLRLDPHEQLAQLLPALAFCLQVAPEAPLPTPGAEVHEAAALALGDACVDATLCRSAVELGVLDGLVRALNEQPEAIAFRANAVWAIHKLYQIGDLSSRALIQTSGAASACERVLKEKVTKAHLGATKAKSVEASVARMLDGQGENLTQFV